MKYEPGEDYAKWLERVRMYEYGVALQQIALGEPAEEVLEKMSKRMVQKGLHPILKAIQDKPTNYNAEEARQRYEENMKTRGPVADHVVEDKNE
jgi:glutamyl-tRNA reductase